MRTSLLFAFDVLLSLDESRLKVAVDMLSSLQAEQQTEDWSTVEKKGTEIVRRELASVLHRRDARQVAR